MKDQHVTLETIFLISMSKKPSQTIDDHKQLTALQCVQTTYEFGGLSLKQDIFYSKTALLHSLDSYYTPNSHGSHFPD